MYGILLNVPRLPGRLSGTIADSLGISCMCYYGLDRRRLSGSLLQVPLRSENLSCNVSDHLGVFFRCPDGLGTFGNCLGVFCIEL
ncbi:hypothetical protein DPMN_186746 [Dreissena polymorpha]|uniref:Uncharacterized protein n=1 Tax=Dreissena polymorpha TaxID=45954 RepID=A0A9D4DQW0_DREPO|nr:hypothetical protein DPMN_186746 [Dreissena polymorpha]